MKSLCLVFLAATLLAGCNSSTTSGSGAAGATSAAALLTPGPWRGELATQGQKIPFLFEVKTEAGKPVVYLVNKGLNGEERLRCDEISAAGDSTTIKLHVFDAALVVRADGQDKLKGVWVKYDSKTPYRVPLVATAGAQPLFAGADSKNAGSFSGTWKVVFADKADNSSYPAVGIFQQKGAEATGTFLTTTGDYRYLSGQVLGSTIRMSTFDGSHAFLFTGERLSKETVQKEVTVIDAVTKVPVALSSEKYSDEITGDYYSGKSGHETWTATLDPKAKLPDADTLTYLRKGESRLNFKFPSIVAGSSISPTDPKYRGKVVVLQILGSWCPNCMDETTYLAPWYEQNKARGVEIIGLGYERSSDYQQAASRLQKMKQRFNIGYDLAVAGVSNKDSVARSLPQLAKFLGFPTTIFLDKKGVVRSIRTGFSGPGTGQYYEEEKAHFNRTVDKLLKE
ncbi:peroxiredoxin family protein [Hymenobacter sp. BRD67]|uniref:peroxiredoxin family protein n=1 Tax=Hymenobacter sp. BRD67 TaxID=2675877 RepID=UPI00156674C8|nr:TlpA disulfide reductase family protein [Hymenobacter sp. BRD67]QKG52071.1 TlpA family protein disulfide reductase [Hymenobacter sp. BRD67]